MNLSLRVCFALLVAAVVGALAVSPVTADTTAAATGSGEIVLTLVHNNDGESALLEVEGADGQNYGGVAPFATVVSDIRRAGTSGAPAPGEPRRVALLVSSGDNFLAGSQFQASLDTGVRYYDGVGMSLIGYDASAIGNHEFDFGPDVFANFIMSTRRPITFVSANVDVSAEPWLQRLANGARIAKSVVVWEGGQPFGIVGATTPMLPTISSPRNVVVGDVAPAVQAEVDALQARGINKIILISHLQSIEEDQELLALLSGIDIAVAGGGDELLANDGDLLVPGDEGSIAGPYPIIATDLTGGEVPVVTTSGSYRYAGRLEVRFDSGGNVVAVDESSGPVRVTTGAANPDAVQPDGRVQARVTDPVTAFVAELATTPAGTTQTPLDSRRGTVSANGAITIVERGERVSETNLGDLATDAYVAAAADLAASFGADVPDVAITNGGGIRQPDEVTFPNASAGGPETVNRSDVADQFPFPNFLTVSEDVTTDALKGLLENAVSRVEFVDGRFAQVSGLVYQWDSTRAARVADDDCVISADGDRITYIAHDAGNDGVDVTVLYDASAGGWLVDQATFTLDIASIDFLSLGGGDCYDFGEAETTVLGVQYGQVVEDFITNGLGGVITAADYPFEGAARIQQVG